jgi:hypothetical protein
MMPNCNSTTKEYIKDSITQVKDSCIEDCFLPDMKINDIQLNDIQSVERKFGNLKSSVKENDSSLPFVEFLNDDGTEKLTAYLFYGSDYNELYQFKIEFSNNQNNDLNHLDYQFFLTESNIKLGMSEKQLIEIKGQYFTKENDIIRYTISDFKKSCFLQKYNLPIYFAEYTFNDNMLIKIYFGFQYP